jgi:hypothetical protein
MVHALDEAWRILHRDGILVDLRPRVANPHVQVLSPAGVLHAGRLDDSADLADDLAADQAIAHAVDRGWFKELEHASFLYDYYWDTAEEMYDYIQDNWNWAEVPQEVYQEAKRLAASLGPDSQVRIRIPMILTTYRKIQE